jgi:hypothetical protein
VGGPFLSSISFGQAKEIDPPPGGPGINTSMREAHSIPSPSPLPAPGFQEYALFSQKLQITVIQAGQDAAF